MDQELFGGGSSAGMNGMYNARMMQNNDRAMTRSEPSHTSDKQNRVMNAPAGMHGGSSGMGHAPQGTGQMGNLAGQAALQQQIMAMSAMMGQGPFPAMSDGAQSGGAVSLSPAAEATLVKVRGLPYKANQQHLYQFFSSLRIRSNGVQLHILPDGRPSGEALVAFETAEEAAQACELDRRVFNSEFFGDRYVRVGRLHPKDPHDLMPFIRVMGGPSAAPKEMHSNSAVENLGSDATSVCIKMKSLPYAAREHDVSTFLSDFSVAEGSVHVILHPDGKSTGEAFAEMSSVEEAKRAVKELDRTVFAPTLGGRFARVVRVPRAEMTEALELMAQSASLGSADTHGYLKLKGLPFKATEADIQDFFQGYAVVDMGVRILLQDDKRASGMAFVEFESPQEAQRAMEKDHSIFHEKHGERYVTLLQVTRAEVDTTLATGVRGTNVPGQGKGGHQHQQHHQQHQHQQQNMQQQLAQLQQMQQLQQAMAFQPNQMASNPNQMAALATQSLLAQQYAAAAAMGFATPAMSEEMGNKRTRMM